MVKGEAWWWETNYETSNGSSDHVSKIDDDDQCSTRKIVKSECKIEEVEPGKFIKRCQKTEQILKNCIGKPAELVKSTTEYTNEDVTNEKHLGPFHSVQSELKSFNFPGLQDDIETIEKNVFGGLRRFFEAAEDMVNGFDEVFGSRQHNDGDSSFSSSFRQKIPIESQLDKGKETSSEQRNDKESVYSEFAGQVRDV